MGDKDNAAGPCPYCADPDLFATVGRAMPDKGLEVPRYLRIGPYLRGPISATVGGGHGPAFKFKSEARGGYWLHRFGEAQLAERLAGFTVLLLGVVMPSAVEFPPGPFFQTTIDRGRAGGPWRHSLFFAFRATHKAHKVAVDVHLWPTHEKIVTLRGMADAGLAPEELKTVGEALKLLRAETRGEPKVTTVKIVGAMQKLGEGATQSGVAKRLGVGERTVRDWLQREGLTWGEAKRRYMGARIL